MSLHDLKVGDKVTRFLGGSRGVKMPMIVTKVDRNIITCGAVEKDGTVAAHGWTFDRDTGAEEDADLMWGVKFGRTGSYIMMEVIDDENGSKG